MLSCREITELTTAYTERVLPFGERARFMLHVSICKGCRQYVRQISLIVNAVGRAPRPAPKPETRQALLRAFRNWKGDPPAP